MGEHFRETNLSQKLSANKGDISWEDVPTAVNLNGKQRDN